MMASYVATTITANRVRQTGTFDGANTVLSTGGVATGYRGVHDAIPANTDFPCWITSTGGESAEWGTAYHAGATGGNVTLTWRQYTQYGAALTSGQAVVARIGPAAEGQAFVGALARADVYSVPDGGVTVTGWSYLHDPFDMWSTTGSLFQLPSWAGAVRCSMSTRWASASGGTFRSSYAMYGGVTGEIAQNAPAIQQQQFSGPVLAADSNVIQFGLNQDSATGKDANFYVSIEFWPGANGVT